MGEKLEKFKVTIRDVSLEPGLGNQRYIDWTWNQIWVFDKYLVLSNTSLLPRRGRWHIVTWKISHWVSHASSLTIVNECLMPIVWLDTKWQPAICCSCLCKSLCSAAANSRSAVSFGELSFKTEKSYFLLFKEVWKNYHTSTNGAAGRCSTLLSTLLPNSVQRLKNWYQFQALDNIVRYLAGVDEGWGLVSNASMKSGLKDHTDNHHPRIQELKPQDGWQGNMPVSSLSRHCAILLHCVLARLVDYHRPKVWL